MSLRLSLIYFLAAFFLGTNLIGQDMVVLRAGPSQPLLTFEQVLQVPAGPGYYLEAEFGFGTGEVVESEKFLDSFTLSLEGRGHTAIFATLDASGTYWAPQTPGTLTMDPAWFTIGSRPHPAVLDEYTSRNSWFLRAPIPEALGDGPVTFRADLFSNLDENPSSGWLGQAYVVPEPGTLTLFTLAVVVLVRFFRSGRATWLFLLCISIGSGWAEEKVFSINGNPLRLSHEPGHTAIYYQAMRLNRVSNVWNFEVVVENRATRELSGPFLLLIEKSEAGNNPVSPDGIDSEGNSFYDLTPWTAEGILPAGGRSRPRTLSLAYSGAPPGLRSKLFYAPPMDIGSLGLLRTLNGVGQPLGSVLIQENGPTEQRILSSEEGSGLATLGQNPGLYRWKFSKPGFFPAWAEARLEEGVVRQLGTPRLVTREGILGQIRPIDGGDIATPGGDLRLRFEAATFQQEMEVMLKPLNSQNLPAALPLGWSPMQAFWIDFGGIPARSVQATVSPWGSFYAGEPAVLARWDESLLTWMVEQVASGNGTNSLIYLLSRPGAYALVVGDTGHTAPPVARVAAPLLATSFAVPDSQVQTLQGGGQLKPAVAPASKNPESVTAQASVTITNMSGVLPSGVLLQCEISENYKLQNGAQQWVPSYTSFIRGFQRPGDQDPATVAARFELQPSRLWESDELIEAVLDVQVLTLGTFEGGVLGPEGGFVSRSGLRLIAGAGDYASKQAVEIRELDGGRFAPLFAPEMNLIRAFEFRSGPLAEGGRLRMDLGAQQPEKLFVLARVISAGGSSALEPVERFRSDSSGTLRSIEPGEGARLTGLSRPGEYLLMQVSSPQALVTGTAHSASGDPAGGLLVRTLNAPWTTLSAANGRYFLLAEAGERTFQVRELFTGNAGAQTADIAEGGPLNTVDLHVIPSGPKVISVVPSNGATNVSRVAPIQVEFSKPLNPATVSASTVELLDGAGTRVPGTVNLNLRRTGLTVLPHSPLPPASTHTLQLDRQIADLSGLQLEGPSAFTFRTASDLIDRTGAQLITYEPVDGVAGIYGSPGTAEPGLPVILVNETSGVTATTTSNPDGSFTNSIAANIDDFISAVLVNKNGSRTSIQVSRQVFQDGRVGLFNAGGILEAESDGGPVQVIIEPGAIEEKNIFKIAGISLPDLLAKLGDLRPPGDGKVLAGLTYSASGDSLKSGADVRMKVAPEVLEVPPGENPTNGVYALARVIEVKGVQVFEVLDKMEYVDGWLETHSWPFPSFSDVMDTMDLFALKLGFGGKVVIRGRVLALGGGLPEKPVRGATVFASEEFLESGDSSELSRGTVVATADENGAFALLTHSKEGGGSSFALLATSPFFPNRFGIGSATVPDALFQAPLAVGDVIFNRRSPPNAPPDTRAPIISMAHLPLSAATNEPIRVQVFASDDGSHPDVDLDLIYAFALGGDTSPITTSDVTLQLESGGYTAQSSRWVYKLISKRAADVLLLATATDQSGNLSTAAYTIGVGLEDPPVTNPPLDPSDRVGPYLVDAVPHHGVTDFDRFETIKLTFSEPVSDAFLNNLPAAVQLSPAAGVPQAHLSQDKTDLYISYPAMEAGVTYSLTVNGTIRDLNNNQFDQNPHNNLDIPGAVFLDSFSMQFKTKPAFFAPLPQMQTGGGVVLGKRGELYALDRKPQPGGAFLAGGSLLRIYHTNAVGDYIQLTSIRLPDYPRDLVYIPDYSFKDGQQAVQTKDLVLATGGLVGDNTVQWLVAIDVTHPAESRIYVNSRITRNPTAAVLKLAWSAPMLGYLETTADYTAVGLVDLQLFLYSHTVGKYDNEPLGGFPGEDKNGDGDYVDEGESIPRPDGRRIAEGVLNAGLVAAYTLGEDTLQRITDFALGFGGRYVGVVFGRGVPGLQHGYRTLVANGLPVELPDGFHEFPRQPDRLLPLFGVQLITNGVLTAANVVLVSGGQPNTVSVLDVTEPATPRWLSDIPIDPIHGRPMSAVLGADGRIYLAAERNIIVLEPSRLAQSSGGNSHPAILGVIHGLGSGSRSFIARGQDLIAVNLSSRARISTQTAPNTTFSVQATSAVDYNLKIEIPLGGNSEDVGQLKKRYSHNGVLEIVMNNSENLGFLAETAPDGLTLPADFPVWTVDDKEPRIGRNVEYDVPGYGNASIFSGPNLLPLVSPLERKIRCEGETITVRVYPNVKNEIKVKSDDIARFIGEVPKKALEELQKVLTTNISPYYIEIKPPTGKINVINVWKECPDSHLAYWTFDVEVGFDPLLEAKVGYQLKPPLPAFLKNYLDPKLFLGGIASSKLQLRLSRKECGEFTFAAPMEIKIGVAAEVSIKAKSKILEVVAGGESSIKGSGNFAMDLDGLKLKKARADWEPLELKITAKFKDGKVEYADKWKVYDTINLIPEHEILLYSVLPPIPP